MDKVRCEQEQYDMLKKDFLSKCEERGKLFVFILKQSQVLSRKALLNMAIDMAGFARVIRTKISLGIPLTKLELKYISEHIK